MALIDHAGDGPNSKDASHEAAPQNTNAAVFSKMTPAKVTEMLTVFPEDMLVDLVQKYVTDTSERLDLIVEAVANGDVATVNAQGHSIKGSSLVLGFSNISEWSRQLEQHTNEQQLPSDIIHAITKELAEIAACL